MASDSTSLHLLTFFPELHKELDATFKDITGRATKPSLQHSKERVIIAESFLNKMPDLKENSQKELVALIKEVGNSRELKARLKDWEPSPTGGLSTLLSLIPSFLVSKETSKIIDEAAAQSKNTKDWVFFAALQNKVSQKPLLEQLAQDFVAEASRHFQDSIKHYLPRLCSRAQGIKQRAMYRQVEAEVNDQDQKRIASIRSEWFDEIEMAQAEVDPG